MERPQSGQNVKPGPGTDDIARGNEGTGDQNAGDTTPEGKAKPPTDRMSPGNIKEDGTQPDRSPTTRP